MSREMMSRVRKPGSTLPNRCAVRSITAAVISSITDAVICATTSQRRSRHGPKSDPKSPRAIWTTSARVVCSAGASPKTTPVPSAAISMNASTRQSGGRGAIRMNSMNSDGMVESITLTAPVTARRETANPAAAAGIASSTLFGQQLADEPPSARAECQTNADFTLSRQATCQHHVRDVRARDQQRQAKCHRDWRQRQHHHRRQRESTSRAIRASPPRPCSDPPTSRWRAVPTPAARPAPPAA